MDSTNQQQNQRPNKLNIATSENLKEDLINEIRKDVLKKSNYYRQKHKLDTFTLDNQLSSVAQDWANDIGSRSVMQHRPNNKYGENIYIRSDLNNLGEKAVNGWYNEIKDFNPDHDEDELIRNTITLHMTQLLWKSSLKLGVGVSLGVNHMCYVVANYDPPGNIWGMFKQNLPNITKADIDEGMESSKAENSLMTKIVIRKFNM